jgi:hypothetical protein
MLSCIWIRGVHLYCGWCGDDVFVWVTFLSMEGKVWDVEVRANILFVAWLLSNLLFYVLLFLFLCKFVMSSRLCS